MTTALPSYTTSWDVTEQQSVLMLHRVRELLIRQRTMLVNALRGHLAEFGMVTRQGIAMPGAEAVHHIRSRPLHVWVRQLIVPPRRRWPGKQQEPSVLSL